MDLESLYRHDLNLLVALVILLEERSVNRAALRLKLSQSATSRLLGRLRQLLDDPLFIRQGHQLVPTERALQLVQQLQGPLSGLGELLSEQSFQPQTCHRRFSIAATDYATQTILPFALPRVYREAPNIAMEFTPVQHEALPAQLGPGGADMAICRPTQVYSGLQSAKLGLVSVFCLVSPSHPLANSTMSLQDYLSYPHALIAISDGVKALLDEALSDHPERRVVIRAYHLEAALALLEQLPLIITVPADLAYLVAERYQLKVHSLPFEFQPFDYSLLWHPRVEHSPEQSWLRDLLVQECGKLIDERIRVMGLA